MEQNRQPRYTTLSREPAQLAEQCAEGFRDTIQALGQKVTGYLKTVERFSATADTSTRIAIAQVTKPPFAVLLVRVSESLDQASQVVCTDTRNFYYVRGEIGVYEPDGLTADTLYDLTFLVLG